MNKFSRRIQEFVALLFGGFSTYYVGTSLGDLTYKIFPVIPAIILSFSYLFYLFPYSLFQKRAFDTKGYLLKKLLPAYIFLFILLIIEKVK
tara:strand:+ start:1203 stop:1475 length:273 start_codon:yes stop_codon:yes gene_type:complete